MKKISLVLLFAVLFISSQVFAAVVTERKINKPTQTPQTQQQSKPVYQTGVKKTSTSKNNKLANSIKTCSPYSESMKSDYLGMNILYKISIAGWVNNKCQLNFSADTSGASSSFSNLYGADPSTVTVISFMPNVRCEFTKEQLEYVGDSILQENDRSNGGKMLKDPNNIDISSFGNLSSSDQRLMDVILNQNACTITNGNELNNMMQNIILY